MDSSAAGAATAAEFGDDGAALVAAARAGAVRAGSAGAGEGAVTAMRSLARSPLTSISIAFIARMAMIASCVLPARFNDIAFCFSSRSCASFCFSCPALGEDGMALCNPPEFGAPNNF
jgi:hypothetical protein